MEKWPARGVGAGESEHEEEPVHNPINDQASNKLESKVASPKKLKNPTTSVTVVNTIEEDWAGSCLSAFKAMGMIAPDNPAMTIEIIMDRPMMKTNPNDRLHNPTARHAVAETARPFKNAT